MIRPILAVVVLSLASVPALNGQSPTATPAAPTPVPTLPVLAPGQQLYKIDVSHSELSFTIRHMISKVRGQFNAWSGTIAADPKNWENASVDVTIQTASINTNNERRDNHLRTSDFFQADQYPTITFKSTKVQRNGDDLTINGNLTMRGVTKPVVLKGKYIGTQAAGRGKSRIGFEASTTINRMDYGVAWNRALEGGGATLGDDVTIDIAVAAVQQ